MIPQEKIDRERRVLQQEIEDYYKEIEKLKSQISDYDSLMDNCIVGLVLLNKDPEAYFRNPEEEEDGNG
jgi:hypothetical protein